MLIPENVKHYIGQGDNPDLSFLVASFDKKLDESFGISYEDQEEQILSTNEALYKDHEAQALLTSYLDYHQIFLDLGEGKTLVDVGAGYCRGSLLATDASYKIRCVSVEMAPTRVDKALKYSQDIIVADICSSDFSLPLCDALFLYLPTGELLNQLLKLLIHSSLEGTIIYVIESHGDFVDNLKFYPELFEQIPSKLVASTQRHDLKIYKFRLQSTQKALEKFKQVSKNDFSKIDLLPFWILKFGKQETMAKIESKVIGSDIPRIWRGNLQSAQLIRYHGEFALQLMNPFRILQLETQDKIYSE